MSKELEALESFYWILSEKSKYKYINPELENYEIVKQALQRLEAIENTKPSEALECLKTPLHNEWLRFYPQFKEIDETTKFVDGCRMVKSDADNYIVIKQALIKAQEQDRVLKIIFEKGLPLPEIDIIRQSKDYNEYCAKWSWIGKTTNISIQKNQEEFDLLKAYFKN